MHQGNRPDVSGGRAHVRKGWVRPAILFTALISMFQVGAAQTSGNQESCADAGAAGQPMQSPETGATSVRARATQHATLIPPQDPSDAGEPSLPQTPEDQWGVKILGIRLSAAGRMLDFRYQVLDPDKARPLFDREVKPVLTHEATGGKCGVPSPPKIGPLRNTRNVEKGKHYFILFANPGAFVKARDKVTVTVGDFRAEHLTVE